MVVAGLQNTIHVELDLLAGRTGSVEDERDVVPGIVLNRGRRQTYIRVVRIDAAIDQLACVDEQIVHIAVVPGVSLGDQRQPFVGRDVLGQCPGLDRQRGHPLQLGGVRHLQAVGRVAIEPQPPGAQLSLGGTEHAVDENGGRIGGGIDGVGRVLTGQVEHEPFHIRAGRH
jgi:hypothetical protein